MKHRIICFFLVLLLIVETLSLQPFALENEFLTDDHTRYIVFDIDHGYCICSAKETSRIAIIETEYPDIYIAENGALFSYAGDGKYQIVEKHIVTLNSPDHVCSQLSDIDIDEETKQDIINMAREQNKLGNTAAFTVIFSPISAIDVNDNNNQTRANDYDGYQYIHNGTAYDMKDWTIYYINLYTGWYTLEAGVSAKVFAQNATTFLLTAADLSLQWNAFSIFLSGITLLDAFCNAVGCTPNQIYGTDPNTNKVQVNVIYDRYQKRTAKKVTGIYIYMLQTERCTIRQIKTETYFVINNTQGMHSQWTRSCGTNGEDYRTPHYSNPAPYVFAAAEAYYEANYEMLKEELGGINLRTAAINGGNGRDFLFYPFP